MRSQRLAGIAFLFFIVLFAGIARAAVIDEVARDFKPLSGYVIMPVQGEFLIDQDAAKGVAVGDLFSVVKPGEKIVHPVTKAVLGTLDEVKGLLQVTRVKSGYAYARPLGEAKGIERGDVVRRFENVSATFWDYTGQGEAFYAELTAALPNLAWIDYAAAQAARPQVPAAPGKGGGDLVFILRHDGLEVRDAAFQALHAYPSPVASGTPAVAPIPVAVPVPAPPVAAGSVEARLKALEQQAAAAPGEKTPYRLDTAGSKAPAGVSYEASFPGFLNLGELPGVTIMTDFLQDGGRTLMAATDGETIQVFSLDGNLTPIASGDTTYVAQILGLHWWRPVAGGELYLAATGWNGRRLESALFALRGDKLVVVEELIPYILGTFDRDGDGRAELLLGQSFDASTFFGPIIRQLELTGGDLKVFDVTFKLPPHFTVQGSLFADLTGDGKPETIYVSDGLLHIYAGEKEIYKSPKQMGGSLAAVTYETNPNAKDSILEHAFFEVPPVAVDLDKDGIKELLAVASERPIMAAPGFGPGVNKSWLAVIKHRDQMFVKGTVGEELAIPLQGLAVAGGRVLFVASEPPSILGQGGGSHLLAFPLAQ